MRRLLVAEADRMTPNLLSSVRSRYNAPWPRRKSQRLSAGNDKPLIVGV